ncbi:unnamed protein product, partial [Mesorhabditis spiculigera]
MGGDEFGLIVCTSSRDDPGVIFDRYLEVLHEPFFVEGNRIEVRATIGYSSAPEDSNRRRRIGDAGGSGSVRSEVDGAQSSRQVLAAAAGEGIGAGDCAPRAGQRIEEGQFDLHYQPQVDTQTGEVVAFEALLRWNHPSRGLIGPSQFISVAEETGMIIPSLVSREFGAMVKKALTDSGLAPHLLQLEITETGVVDDRAIRDLYKLRELGVTVALDDFGTGYSSFATLQRLPIDVLKIDRMLVTDSGRSEDVRGEVHRRIGRGPRSRRVQWVGCDLVQGYHISKALTAERVDVYLAATDTETGHLSRADRGYRLPLSLDTSSNPRHLSPPGLRKHRRSTPSIRRSSSQLRRSPLWGSRRNNPVQCRVYPFDQQDCRFGITGNDSQIFFSARTSDDSVFAEMCAQSVRGSSDDDVAFGMTVKIIHRLEFVDIDDDESERRRIVSGALGRDRRLPSSPRRLNRPVRGSRSEYWASR